MVEYDLWKKSWFGDMYDLRHHWIPVYFKDIVLGGSVRTNPFLNRKIFELLIQFESAMKTQHHHLLKNDFDSTTRDHTLKTPLLIEKHESEVKLTSLFWAVPISCRKYAAFGDVISLDSSF
ncbi:hypothetical protein V2J09_021160 [Rumex salicifolius]